MDKHSRFLGSAIFLALTIILGATIWKQSQIERTRVVRIEIVHKQMLRLTTAPPINQKWIWNGAQAQSISDQLKLDNTGCLGLDKVNRLRSLDEISIRITRQADEPTTYNFDPRDGITYAGKKRCERLLTPQSLKYFHDLMAQTTPNAR